MNIWEREAKRIKKEEYRKRAEEDRKRIIAEDKEKNQAQNQDIREHFM